MILQLDIEKVCFVTILLLVASILGIGRMSSAGEQAYSQPPVKDSPRKKKYSLNYKGIYVAGKEWKVSVSLEGSVEVASDGEAQKYHYTLGSLGSKTVKTSPDRAQPDLKYAKSFTIVRKTRSWKANFRKNTTTAERKSALQIVQNSMQFFFLREKIVAPRQLRSLKLSSSGRKEKKQDVRLMSKHIMTEEPIVYMWKEKSRWDKQMILWTLERHENMARILRIKRESERNSESPNNADFMKLISDIRVAFLRNKLSAETVSDYGGAIEVTVCTIKKVEKQKDEGEK